MSEGSGAAVTPINSPWHDVLIDTLKQVRHSLLIVSPYIKEEVVSAMLTALLSRTPEQNTGLAVRIITRVEPEELLNGSSDITALQPLLNWPEKLINSTVEMRAIPNVHAKVWVCDTHLAIIGSGNATPSGLDSNIEYSLKVADPQLVERILQDWQQWWEHPNAASVEASELERMRQKLHKIEISDEVIQAATQRKAIKSALEIVPHIGKRISLHKAKPKPQSLLRERPLTAANEAVSNQEYLYTYAYPFWQAFRWVTPQEDGQAAERDVFLKLSWKPAQASPHIPPLFQFIWADGKRHSRATITLHNDTIQYPGTITLDRDAIKELSGFLRNLEMKDLLSKHRAQGQLQLSQATRSTENASVHKLFIRYLQDISQSWSNGSTTVSYTPANAPGPFPTQRPPISQIMVEQTRLQQALAALAPYASTTIELCLDTPASLSSVTLSTGKIASPVTETISGKDYILIGPATKLRLDFFSLQHIVTSAPEHVTHWRLCIDRAAEAVQLIPLPYAVQDTALLWRHELRSHFL